MFLLFVDWSVNTKHKAPEKCAISIPIAINTAHTFQYSDKILKYNIHLRYHYVVDYPPKGWCASISYNYSNTWHPHKLFKNNSTSTQYI